MIKTASLTVEETSIRPVEPGEVPLIRRPASHSELPVVVSIPHYGTGTLPGFRAEHYVKPEWGHFSYGFADAFAPAIYGDLHLAGATLITTPLSRMFVDVNRPRGDFDEVDGTVRSHLGVVRTHTRRGEAILQEFPTLVEVEHRLRCYYDPYYAALKRELERIRCVYGSAVLIDAHTASARGLGEHTIVLGTRHGRTISETLLATVEQVFASHELATTRDLRGYIGAHILRTFGRPKGTGVHGIQIEVNSGLLHTMSHRELVDRVMLGERPPPKIAQLNQLRRCMAALVKTLGRTLLHH